MSKVKARRPYDPTVRTSITFPKETMAKQSFKAECDINTIMSKYQRTGLIDHVQKFQGSYGDFTSVQDYQLSLNQVLDAQEAFDALPATVRERFANDPARLLGFLEDPKNLDEAVKLGLVEPKPPAEEKKSAGAPPQTPPPASAKPADGDSSNGSPA